MLLGFIAGLSLGTMASCAVCLPCFAQAASPVAGSALPEYQEEKLLYTMDLVAKYWECSDRIFLTDGDDRFAQMLSRSRLSERSCLLKLKAKSNSYMTRQELKEFFSRPQETEIDRDFLWIENRNSSLTAEQRDSLFDFLRSLGYRKVFVRNAYSDGVGVLLSRVDAPAELLECQTRLARDMRLAGALLGAHKNDIDEQFMHLHHRHKGNHDYILFRSQCEFGGKVLFKCSEYEAYSLKFLPKSYSLMRDESLGRIVTLWPEIESEEGKDANFKAPTPWLGLRPAAMKISAEDAQREAVFQCIDDMDGLTLYKVKQKLGESDTLVDRESGDKYLSYFVGPKKFNIFLADDVYLTDVVVFQETRGKITSIEIARLESLHAFHL